MKIETHGANSQRKTLSLLLPLCFTTQIRLPPCRSGRVSQTHQGSMAQLRRSQIGIFHQHSASDAPPRHSRESGSVTATSGPPPGLSDCHFNNLPVIRPQNIGRLPVVAAPTVCAHLISSRLLTLKLFCYYYLRPELPSASLHARLSSSPRSSV